MASVRTMGSAAALLMGLGVLPAGAQEKSSTALDVLIQQCAPCHGVDGIGHDTEIPNLAGQHDRYLWLQMMAFRRGTRRHQEMRYMSRSLSEDEIAALVQYYSSLPR
ncbi:c-type cytochrome [Azorhizobium doebereinerae]|uniref:c-type cytochrome n=1 Tax=Azorhizobium doebereinerae TaxID=281091 RepID=UPI0003F66224|nr:c-type cytochrome [Azorhizobium doebereinerae]